MSRHVLPHAPSPVITSFRRISAVIVDASSPEKVKGTEGFRSISNGDGKKAPDISRSGPPPAKSDCGVVCGVVCDTDTDKKQTKRAFEHEKGSQACVPTKLVKHTHRDTHTETHTQRHTHRDTHTQRHTHRDTHTQRHTHRDTHTTETTGSPNRRTRTTGKQRSKTPRLSVSTFEPPLVVVFKNRLKRRIKNRERKKNSRDALLFIAWTK